MCYMNRQPSHTYQTSQWRPASGEDDGWRALPTPRIRLNLFRSIKRWFGFCVPSVSLIPAAGLKPIFWSRTPSGGWRIFLILDNRRRAWISRNKSCWSVKFNTDRLTLAGHKQTPTDWLSVQSFHWVSRVDIGFFRVLSHFITHVRIYHTYTHTHTHVLLRQVALVKLLIKINSTFWCRLRSAKGKKCLCGHLSTWITRKTVKHLVKLRS